MIQTKMYDHVVNCDCTDFSSGCYQYGHMNRGQGVGYCPPPQKKYIYIADQKKIKELKTTTYKSVYSNKG